MNKFEIIKKIGKGSFASVYQIRRKDDNQQYALKRVNIPNMSLSDKEHALNEVRVLASFSHPNIISYKESFYSEDTKTLDIIMEYAECGDILSLIKKAKINKTTINERTIWIYLIHILFGLRALHERKFVHRDLKSANVFICKGNIAKIGDFNVTKQLKATSFLQSQTGTPYYASPEIWQEKPYDMRSDIWSLGCIIYEMCTLQVPFQATSIPLLCKIVTKGEYKPIPAIYSKGLSIVLSELLIVDINKRKTSEQLINHPLIINKMNLLSIFDLPNIFNPLDTIKLPIKKDDFNSVLPKTKKYYSSMSSNISSSQAELIFVAKKSDLFKQQQEEDNKRLHGTIDNSNMNDNTCNSVNSNNYNGRLLGKGRAQSTKIIDRLQQIRNSNITNYNHRYLPNENNNVSINVSICLDQSSLLKNNDKDKNKDKEMDDCDDNDNKETINLNNQYNNERKGIYCSNNDNHGPKYERETIKLSHFVMNEVGAYKAINAINPMAKKLNAIINDKRNKQNNPKYVRQQSNILPNSKRIFSSLNPHHY